MESLWSWMVFIAAISVIISAHLRLRSPASTERGPAGEFLWEKGGAWIGFYGASGPLATFSGDRDALCISFGYESHVFVKDRIVALRMYRSLLSGTLYIEHAVPIYPRHVKFAFTFGPRSPRFNRIKDQLVTLGYAVTEKPSVLLSTINVFKSFIAERFKS